MTRLLRAVGWSMLGVIAICAAYVGAAIMAATLLARGSNAPAEAGEPLIFVCATPFHAEILLPVEDGAADWREVFPDLLPEEIPAGAMLAFGWGDLGFFRDVPEWTDLTFSSAVAALSGLNEVAMRVSVVMPPSPSAECRPLHVDKAARSRLAQHILSTFARGDGGGVLRHDGGSRFTGFFAAHGRYSPFRTCNQWVADAMAEAGLPHAPFAPFSFGVLWPLGEAAHLH